MPGARWPKGVHEVLAVAADGAQDVAQLAGLGVEAFHQGEIVVASRLEEGLEVAGGVVWNGHGGTPEAQSGSPSAGHEGEAQVRGGERRPAVAHSAATA